jgi:hypothetical protein
MAEDSENLSPVVGLPLPFQVVEQAGATGPASAITDSGTTPPHVGSLSDLLGGRMITFDEWDIGHLLSDAQLDAISSSKDDTSFGWFTALMGIGISLLQNVWFLGNAVYNGKVPGIWDSIASLICAAAMAGAISKYFEYARNKQQSGKLVSYIKNRKHIKLPQQNGYVP